MLNNKKYKLPLVILFSLIQTVLFFLVQLTRGKTNIIVSYLVVVLCCLFAVLYFEKTKKYAFTQIALFCTIMADLFLVVIHPIMQLPAMIFFLAIPLPSILNYSDLLQMLFTFSLYCV